MDGAGSYSVAHRAGLLPTELTGMWGWILLRSPHQGRRSPPAPAPTKQRPVRVPFPGLHGPCPSLPPPPPRFLHSPLPLCRAPCAVAPSVSSADKRGQWCDARGHGKSNGPASGGAAPVDCRPWPCGSRCARRCGRRVRAREAAASLSTTPGRPPLRLPGGLSLPPRRTHRRGSRTGSCRPPPRPRRGCRRCRGCLASTRGRCGEAGVSWGTGGRG